MKYLGKYELSTVVRRARRGVWNRVRRSCKTPNKGKKPSENVTNTQRQEKTELNRDISDTQDHFLRVPPRNLNTEPLTRLAALFSIPSWMILNISRLGKILVRNANRINAEESHLTDIHSKVHSKVAFEVYMHGEMSKWRWVYLMEWLYKVSSHPVFLCDLS